MNEKMTDENMEKKANSNLQNNEEAVDLNQDTNKDEANEPQEQPQATEEDNSTEEEKITQQMEEKSHHCHSTHYRRHGKSH